MFSKKIKLFVFGFAILLGSASVRAADAGKGAAVATCVACAARSAIGERVVFPATPAILRQLFDATRCVDCNTAKLIYAELLRNGVTQLDKVGGTSMTLRPRK